MTIKHIVILGDFDDETWMNFRDTICDMVDLHTVEGTLNAKIMGNYGDPAMTTTFDMIKDAFTRE